jgi:hypothetical protein
VLDEARLVGRTAGPHAQPTLERRKRTRDPEPRLRNDYADRREMRDSKPPAVDESPTEQIARDDRREADDDEQHYAEVRHEDQVRKKLVRHSS